MAYRSSLVQTRFRLRKELIKRLQQEAKCNDRSVTDHVARILEESVNFSEKVALEVSIKFEAERQRFEAEHQKFETERAQIELERQQIAAERASLIEDARRELGDERAKLSKEQDKFLKQSDELKVRWELLESARQSLFNALMNDLRSHPKPSAMIAVLGGGVRLERACKERADAAAA